MNAKSFISIKCFARLAHKGKVKTQYILKECKYSRIKKRDIGLNIIKFYLYKYTQDISSIEFFLCFSFLYGGAPF